MINNNKYYEEWKLNIMWLGVSVYRTKNDNSSYDNIPTQCFAGNPMYVFAQSCGTIKVGVFFTLEEAFPLH